MGERMCVVQYVRLCVVYVSVCDALCECISLSHTEDVSTNLLIFAKFAQKDGNLHKKVEKQGHQSAGVNSTQS